MTWRPGAFGRRRRQRALVAFGLAGAVGLIASLIASHTPNRPRNDEPLPTTDRFPAPQAATLAPSPPSTSAPRPIPAPSPAEHAAPVSPANRLRQAVLEADHEARTDPEILDADRLIQGVLRARPQLAGALAELLSKLQNRGLALRIALLLGRFRLDPAVHRALLEALENGPPLAREVAAYAFYGVRGEPEVALALAHGFTGAAGPPPTDEVRAAHAFALAGMFPDLPEPERRAVRALARSELSPTQSTPEVRREAVTLVDAAGADRPRVREVLARDPVRSVAFAAARVLAQAGEGEAALRAALARFRGRVPDPRDRTQAAIRALLEQPPVGSETGPPPPPDPAGRR